MKRLLLAVLLAAPALAHAQPMDFVCTGNVSQAEANGAPAQAGEVVRLRLNGVNGGGSVQLPPSLTPHFSKGKNGWLPLKQLEVTDDSITGQVFLNPVSRPTVFIDRRTGDIDLKGLGVAFDGACLEAPAVRGKF